MSERWGHGVGIVDAQGPQCICDKDFPFTSGGWVAFNAHLSDAVAPLRDAITFTAIPTLLVFADGNAGVRAAIGVLDRAVRKEGQG